MTHTHTNQKPAQSKLIELGISQPYSSQILSGDRSPSRSLAIKIYRNTSWKHPVIASLSDDDITTLERIGTK